MSLHRSLCALPSKHPSLGKGLQLVTDLGSGPDAGCCPDSSFCRAKLALVTTSLDQQFSFWLETHPFFLHVHLTVWHANAEICAGVPLMLAA